ncbi:MAG TPA: hypothetical protein VNY05_14940 [Candidatus Acidoferrales bacterium]|jgi:hypothetical protein|nr:hypothetical protein [Candidatus Acidoferrales bacterium]
MPTSISWKLTIDIPSGPSLSLSSAVAVEAYDRIAVTVPHSATSPPAEVQVDVQPGAAGRVKFLVIRSDSYGEKLKYKVHDTGNSERILDDTLVLVGPGALDLLGATLDKLLIINTLGQPANIEIIVGRQATA